MADRWRIQVSPNWPPKGRIRLTWLVNPDRSIPQRGTCIAFVTQGKMEGPRLWMMKAIETGKEVFRRRVPQGGWTVRRRKHPNGKPLVLIRGHGTELGLLFYRETVPPNFLQRLADVLGIERTYRRAPAQKEEGDEAAEGPEHQQDVPVAPERSVEAGPGDPPGGGPAALERGEREEVEAG